mgnify:CR=1 FL=1
MSDTKNHTQHSEQAIVPVPVFTTQTAEEAIVITQTPSRATTLEQDASEPFRIVLLGDIVGRPGRAALKKDLQKLRDSKGVDLVIAQSENLAHGFGITPETITDIMSSGVDVATGGNHTWKNSAGVQLLASGAEPTVLRPANAAATLAGPTHVRVRVPGMKHDIVISCLLGQVFMKDIVASPFETATALFETYKEESVHYIFDLHAEATGEKRIFGHFVDGKALVVVGTHTHVQTADEEILEKGTAYITDLGFTGALDSSLGMRRDLVMKKVALKEDVSLEPATEAGDTVIHGVLVTLDRTTEQPTQIERIAIISREK